MRPKKRGNVITIVVRRRLTCRLTSILLLTGTNEHVRIGQLLKLAFSKIENNSLRARREVISRMFANRLHDSMDSTVENWRLILVGSSLFYSSRKSYSNGRYENRFSCSFKYVTFLRMRDNDIRHGQNKTHPFFRIIFSRGRIAQVCQVHFFSF
nr:PREDICTED: LOW QUALITY PROTEIN: uncharacterized protein LOC105664161 [Megachile rotundata]